MFSSEGVIRWLVDVIEFLALSNSELIRFLAIRLLLCKLDLSIDFAQFVTEYVYKPWRIHEI